MGCDVGGGGRGPGGDLAAESGALALVGEGRVGEEKGQGRGGVRILGKGGDEGEGRVGRRLVGHGRRRRAAAAAGAPIR
uniref:Flowering locus D n=1 Tax=Arundo donax TaxID=35708 RepID=A0A0A9H261_ARUDO